MEDFHYYLCRWLGGGMEIYMEYMGTKEAAEKWGYVQGTISKWCREGKISLVVKPEKKGGQWQIPVNAECPKKEKGKKI